MWLISMLFSLPAHQPQPQRQPQPPPQQQQQQQQQPQQRPQQSQQSTVSPLGFFIFHFYFILHLFYILATTITSTTSTTTTYHHQHQHHQHHPHFKQPPSHLTRQNGNGNRSRNSRRNASRVTGKSFWFSLFSFFHYTNIYFSLDYEWITAWDK